MAETAIKKVLASQPLLKEGRNDSDQVVLNDIPLRVFAGETVKTGAQESVTEQLDDLTVKWIFVEAIAGLNADKRKGFVDDRFLVAEGAATPEILGVPPFPTELTKEDFVDACVVQAALFQTNPAYLYALAYALSGKQWSETQVRTSDPANAEAVGVFRFPKETWSSLLVDDAKDIQTSWIKFPDAQCVVAAIVAAKSADLLKDLITDRSISAVDLLLAHLFADNKSFGSNAVVKMLQAEGSSKTCADIIEKRFLARNEDFFGTDGSTSIEGALTECAKALDAGFTDALKVARQIQDKEGDETSLFESSVPSDPTGPIIGGDSAIEGTPGTGATGGGVIESQQKQTRHLPISQQLHDILEYAGRKISINVEVYSGGQPPSGPDRVGSHRHDVGGGGIGAADLFMRDAKTNQVLDSDKAADRERMAEFIEQSAAAGATGIGHAAGYMGTNRTHIGGGLPEAVWGAGNSRSGAPNWVIEAFERGRRNALTRTEVAQRQQSMRAADHSGVSGGQGTLGQSPHQDGGDTAEATGRRPSEASPETDAAIVAAAREFDFDPNTCRAIGSIESSLNPESNRNRRTQYKGLYQIGNDEWAKFGLGGDIFSARDNAMAFGRMTRAHAEQFKSRFSRSPTDTELYMIHQQGFGFYTRRVMTNINGNPYPGMRGPQTPESFAAGWGRELMRRKAWFARAHPTA
jgi:hypothetical protein